MANYYCSALATGGGDGSQGNPWTLAEAVAAINAGDPWADGDTLYVKNDGKYTTTGIAITNPGAPAAISKIIGYTAVITDGGIPEIERSGGTGNLFDMTSATYWKVNNLELDGQNAGEDNLVSDSAYRNIYTNIISHHSPGNGFYARGHFINCYAYSNLIGYYAGIYLHNCIAKDNTNEGFLYPGVAINCIGKNNKYNFSLRANNIINNCISDGGSQHGIYCGTSPIGIYNTVIINVASDYYGIYISSGLSIDIRRVNFYNIVSGGSYYCNNISLLGIYYELDPQFVAPASLDYRRTGRNLEDKGLSQIGLQSFDYKIDIGIDQETQINYPDEGDVREGVSYFFGTKEGLLDLPAVFYVKKGIKFDQETKIGTYALASGMSYAVELIFNLGESDEYTFPLVQSISDPIPDIKATVIEGARADGAIIIPGGKRGIEIIVRGILLAGDYQQIDDLIIEMRNKITTNPATLTLRFWTGTTWQNSWQYAVRRISEISFPESMRTSEQEYECRFLVFSY